MKSFAFINSKGGVGKTSLTGNIGYYLSKFKKVCIVDADYQGNITSWLNGAEIDYELAQHLNDDIPVKKILKKCNDNLFLLPTNKKSDGILTYMKSGRLNENQFTFENVNEDLQKEGFDFILYDLHPAMGILEQKIIKSCNEVITPMKADFFSLDGIGTFINQFKKLVTNYRAETIHTKIIINFIDKRISAHKEILKQTEVLKAAYELFYIGVDCQMEKLPALHKSIFEHNPKSKIISELEHLGNKLLEELT